MVVVSVCVVVPHVGGEVAVDVGVGEVCGKAQAEDEASQDTKPTPSAATYVGGEGLLHISAFALYFIYFVHLHFFDSYANMRYNRRILVLFVMVTPTDSR